MAQYRYLIVSTLLGAALMAPGCGRSQEASAPEPTPHEETATLMEEVSGAEFQPPEDGRLTDAQLQLYLQVRERQQAIRREALDGLEDRAPEDPQAAVPETAGEAPAEPTEEVAAASPTAPVAPTTGVIDALEVVGDHTDPALADLQAARELGYNPKEYLWVREQVREAQIARASLLLGRRLAESRERHLAEMEEEKAAATTPAELAAVEERLADFRRGLEESQPELPPAVIYNASLLDRYEERLSAVWAGEERWARDMPASDPATSKRGAE
jgi:hypothetical protein